MGRSPLEGPNCTEFELKLTVNPDEWSVGGINPASASLEGLPVTFHNF